MTKLVLHADFKDEYLKAYDWYAERNLRAAETFKVRVREAMDCIMAKPMGGTVYDEGHRFYRVKKYPHLVIDRYSSDDDTATVVAVSHPSQDQSYWQSR